MMTRLVSICIVCATLLVPVTVFGDDVGVVRMVGLPFEPNGNTSTQVYLGALYRLAIGIAALLAVVRLVLAGAKYILSDVVTQKADAKQDIRTAIIGLLIVLGAVLILTTINPNLNNLSALDRLDNIRISFPNEQIGDSGFNTVFENEVLGSTINWDNATQAERTAFIESCTGTVVTQENNQGVTIGTCTLDVDTPIDVDLVADSQFTTPDGYLDLFSAQAENISSQIGTNVTNNDVRGYVSVPINEIPGDDENAFAVSLQPNCEVVGGSHVAVTLSAGEYQFWCVGRS